MTAPVSELTSQRILRPYVVRYVLALVVVAVAVVTAHVVLERLVTAQETSAAEINVAGQQRTLSQQVAATTARLPNLDGAMRDAVVERLGASIDQLEADHAALRTGDAERGLRPAPPEVLALLDGPAGLDAVVADFVTDARDFIRFDDPLANDPRLVQLLADADTTVLPALDERVSLYEEVADDRVAGQREGARVLTALVLVVLLGTALLVFRPMGGRLVREADALAAAEQHARVLAEQDPVTGLPTRRHVEALVDRLGRQERSVAVAVCDVDGLQSVNREHGRAAGDRLLTVVADVLREVVGDGGTCARLGGQELVAVLPDVQARELRLGHVTALLAERCREDGLPLTTLTWGVSDAAPGGWSAALGRADEAVRAGRSGGRDRVVLLLDEAAQQRAGHDGPVVVWSGVPAQRDSGTEVAAGG